MFTLTGLQWLNDEVGRKQRVQLCYTTPDTMVLVILVRIDFCCADQACQIAVHDCSGVIMIVYIHIDYQLLLQSDC